ncbi:hypothetical protein DFP72DRAFT_1050029 [Ephemerocybe angulata]|uniref:Uncharacterized protein n=1 Tax=Ephemerocybe angulata TaxID=980116 RepID=A0A8H6M0W5_9AGAR|nr:hypothetical protein DFP72DRAFT_1050029 [Tulosesus angulatus]
MSLSTAALSKVGRLIVAWTFQDYITLGFHTTYVCKALGIGINVATRINVACCEIVLLLCLYALLGVKRRFLALIFTIYTALTLGVVLPQLRYIAKTSEMVTPDQLNRELGYACTSGDYTSLASTAGPRIGAYVSLTKGACISALAVVVIYLRYRGQVGSLFGVLRRDSGLYIFSLAALRLGTTIISYGVELDQYGTTRIVSAILQRVAAPVISCSILLKLRASEDPAVRSVVSSILFDTPHHRAGVPDDLEDSVYWGDSPDLLFVSMRPDIAGIINVESQEVTRDSGVV